MSELGGRSKSLSINCFPLISTFAGSILFPALHELNGLRPWIISFSHRRHHKETVDTGLGELGDIGKLDTATDHDGDGAELGELRKISDTSGNYLPIQIQPAIRLRARFMQWSGTKIVDLTYIRRSDVLK